jgi:hypothetical protein
MIIVSTDSPNISLSNGENCRRFLAASAHEIFKKYREAIFFGTDISLITTNELFERTSYQSDKYPHRQDKDSIFLFITEEHMFYIVSCSLFAVFYEKIHHYYNFYKNEK